MTGESFAFAAWVRGTYPTMSVRISRAFNACALDMWRSHARDELPVTFR